MGLNNLRVKSSFARSYPLLAFFFSQAFALVMVCFWIVDR